ncbi:MULTISPECIES: preprotein translocase subunit SecA [Cycloclasticus]|jgi:preprotein translocase subunit SecA|uniref:Protein translocase subunit SecA n=1 Tax=Cycloclasticus zancles 78-ME TaxID=1198232 RepID=S5TZD5_9GAMM|nr:MULTISPECIES: preprotein translocase subunit SecA [Cycloclasticus]AGS40585.1 Preprotein translocase subunit SecA [Cycloclasticus zancles 78-ME]SHJ54739.1 protein translocase subunit secA [Cycloclasticus pugetii]|tara:strand:- start:168 stop:2822 length:2655 start_codon:yes stop_codon:yes gene_type:complete
MISNIVKKVFGSRNDRLVKAKQKTVKKINEIEASISALSDTELKAKTDEFRARLEQGETLDSLIVEAFAVVREAGVRALGMRHFDVQLIGGMVLHDGRIAEMKTGEGKTLVATLSAYLNALPGKGVHMVTVNDYLAERDSQWMGQLFAFLGMTTGVIVNSMSPEQRREAYAADITYGTNNEFGFDYLRDNMAFGVEDKVQRELHYAIVDEVDSILIDEARTPLIISGPTDDKSDLYIKLNELVKDLTEEVESQEGGEYTVDEKSKQVFLTELGHEKIEELLTSSGLLSENESLYDATNIGLMHHVYAALRASALYHKDVDYIIQNGQVVIVDEFTGRTMPGRRWGEGLHQAVEAKEGVKIQSENQTMASITFQNYFRMYDKLSGMTGTADTEAFEFQQIYGLEVIVIPTHRGMAREDAGDLIYLTAKEKYEAVIEDIEDCYQRKQPVLVGTTSIEVSEYISSSLTKKKVPHEVLNAKQHEREAQIIANAGALGAVTIATNMAGRGTDIVLGGKSEDESSEVWQKKHQAVLDAGGLRVIGTERHESRRIDNQLRGRSGRQGDPGASRFYLSLEDSLMRIFASERVSGLMQKLGLEKGESIEHPWVSKAIENAQRKVEGHNFDIRKQLLQYDDVANDQRRVIYDQRNEIMEASDIADTIVSIREDVVNQLIDVYIPAQSIEEQWDIAGLQAALEDEFSCKLNIQELLDTDDSLHEDSLRELILKTISDDYAKKEILAGAEVLRHFEKSVMLQTLDSLWRDHLGAMEHLRQGIHLRGYAQKDPKQEYRREAFELFTSLLDTLKRDVVQLVTKVQVRAEEDVQAVDEQRRIHQTMEYKHDDANALGEEKNDEQADKAQPFKRSDKKIGRNDPCPCGSGKKFKQCHGKL